MLSIPKEYAEEMVTHAREEYPNECCGILAGKDGQVVHLYRMTNTERSPYRYNMNPRELYRVYRGIEDSGWELLAIYHSHTHTPAYPSATDVRLATWPDAYYLVISLEDEGRPITRAFRALLTRLVRVLSLGFLEDKGSRVIRAFRIVDGQVTGEPLEVTAG